MKLAKTTRPSAARVMPRSRLFRRLDRRRARLTWIAGPPGAGKTALVASYVAARRLHTVWYQLDEGDADPATFFYYLGATAAAPRRRALPLFTPEYARGLDAFSRRFFRELFGRLRPPFAIVFDNYERVPSDAPLHDVLREAVEELPEGGRLCVVSRAEPPPAFARLRVHGALDVLDSADLSLTATETAALVRRMAGHHVKPVTARSLHETAQGWVAGLLLLLERSRRVRGAVSSRGPLDRPVEDHLDPRPPSVLFDYFAGEVFEKADATARGVLLATSFLPRVTASLAQALAGVPTAGQVLDDLHRQNYFTSKHPGPEASYQYHPLFRDFLQMRADKELPASQRRDICRKGAGLLEAIGQIADAAALFREGGDTPGLAGLIRRNAAALVAQGRTATLENWFAALGRDVVEADAWLEYWLGACQVSSKPAMAFAHFERAFEAFDRQSDFTGVLLAWSGAVDAIFYQGAGLMAVDPWIDRLEGLVERAGGFPSSDVEARVAFSMFQALTFRRCVHPDLDDWRHRAESAATAVGATELLAMIQYLQAFRFIWQGLNAEACEAVTFLQAAARAGGLSPLATLMALIGSGSTLWTGAASTDAALETLAEARDVAQSTGVHVLDGFVFAHGIYAALCGENFIVADRLLADMRALGEGTSRLVDVAHNQYLAAWAALLRDDLPVATALLQNALRLAEESGIPVFIAQCQLAMATLMHARGEAAAAAAHLARGRAIGRQIASFALAYFALLVEAEFALDGRDERAAVAALREGFAIAKRQGIMLLPWWRRRLMARLCVVALDAEIEVDFVRTLIQKCRLVPPRAPIHVETWPWPVRIHALGRFEIMVNDASLRFTRKVQRKPLALLKAIIALGGHDVREQLLTDALWPDAEGDAAQIALTSAVYRLRRLLGHEQSVRRQDGRVSLDERTCWVDVWALERLLDLVNAMLSDGLDDDAWSEIVRLVDRASVLYRGALLADEPDAPWAIPTAERLRRRLVRLLCEVGGRSMQAAQWDAAARLYERAIDVDPCAEDGYRQLMTIYRRLGRPADVETLYERCRQSLAEILGTSPSVDLERLRGRR